MWRRRRHNRLDKLSKPPNVPPASSKATKSSFPDEQICHQFTISQIRSATENFDKSLLIGRGGFGEVYKGKIKKGSTQTIVALKRWNSASSEAAQEFQAEVEILSMLRHPTIVRLVGYCNDGNEMILVYEYVPNGSLGDHLHKRRTPLSWSQRLKICINVAYVLDYLHKGTSGQKVIYNNVKSANILLDDEWEAKITDFRFSKIIPTEEVSTRFSGPIAGTLGYMDPEYFSTGILSRKSDVYSYGVVLLEVLCRRRVTDRIADEEQWGLVGWAQDCMRKGNLEQLIDPDLRGQVSVKCLNDFARIVECCLRGSQELRITMAEVVFGLVTILALHEITDNSIPQMGITASDWRLQNYFFSSGQKSGGSYFRKDIELLSAESYRHEGEYDHMSETNVDAISEESCQLEKSPEKSIRFFSGEFDFDAASEPNRELINVEFSSGNGTQSLYELMQLEYIQQADVLMRMKDFLHLIWFYPVQKEVEVNFGSLLDKFSLLNECIRKPMDSLRDRNYLMEIQKLLQDIKEDLDDAVFDIVAYLPETGANSGQLPSASFWSGIPEINANAVVSATNRALRCIKDLKVQKLGVSGNGAEEVTERLKDMSELRRVFDMVLCVHVKNHSIEELMDDIQHEIYLRIDKISETGKKVTVLDQFQNCLLFVDCSEAYIDLHGPEFNLSRWFETVQIVMTSGAQNAYCPVDMEIRVEDHLLPWILFSTHVDLATLDNDTGYLEMATRLIEKCNGHLLAIILLARALRDVVDVTVWELALHELVVPSLQPDITSDVMVRVLRFIWSRMQTLSQRCIMRFASSYTGPEIEKSSLINSWIRDGLVKSEQKGENVFEDFIHFFLLEQVGVDYVRMRDETRVVLLAYFVPRAYGLYLKQDGSESNRIPNVEEWDAREIHLSNNAISELPENPDCPILVKLFLHFNQDLIDIPITFFDNMPSLSVLNLSNTSIKCLPSSISKLTTLQKLFIRDCDLLMELPPEIGALKNLKVFDSEGTRLLYLPAELGLLTKLECLKFSLYDFAEKHKRSNQGMQIIRADLSKFRRLKELKICMDSYSEWWEDEVGLFIGILFVFWNLESLRLYFPTTELLDIFMETQNWWGFPIYQHLSNFGFIVGRLQQRLISRVPSDLDKTFVKLPKCLKYTNGEGDTEVIAMALKHAYAFLLDRHWTIRSLSAIGLAEMEKLKFCLLAECNEMLEIVDGSYLESPLRPVLGSLKYLSVHYMKSLKHIWSGPIRSGGLSNLKTLAIHTCPELRTIFTQGLLDNLYCLEYLVVEDCTTINSVVSLESDYSISTACLPSLKKISLLHLPELVSIFRGISIAPRLESLIVYNCPKLEKFSYMEVSDEIKEIKGENEWWDALKWCKPEWTSGQPDYLARVFIPLGIDGDIMDELADAVNLLPHLGIGELTKEARKVQVNTYPGDEVAGPSDKGKGKV